MLDCSKEAAARCRASRKKYGDVPLLPAARVWFYDTLAVSDRLSGVEPFTNHGGQGRMELGSKLNGDCNRWGRSPR